MENRADISLGVKAGARERMGRKGLEKQRGRKRRIDRVKRKMTHRAGQAGKVSDKRAGEVRQRREGSGLRKEGGMGRRLGREPWFPASGQAIVLNLIGQQVEMDGGRVGKGGYLSKYNGHSF